MTPILFASEGGRLVLFDFEETGIGRLCREINRETASLLDELPPRAYESADNLQRAAKSMGRNAAEGWGKWQLADKIRYFQTTRGSGTEYIAALNELVDYRYTTYERTGKARALVQKLVASIIGLIRFLENQPSRPKHGSGQRKPLSQ